VIATAIVAGVTGYFIGQGASLGLFREKQGWPNGYDVKVHKDSSDEEFEEEDSEDEASDEEEEGNGEELAAFKENEEEVKLVLVVRTDLGMTKGTFNSTSEKEILSLIARLATSTDSFSLAFLQVKSLRKLPMLPSPATNTSSPTNPIPPSCAAGSTAARPRSRCRSNRRMSCCCFRRRR
jgi:hypothetical protein